MLQNITKRLHLKGPTTVCPQAVVSSYIDAAESVASTCMPLLCAEQSPKDLSIYEQISLHHHSPLIFYYGQQCECNPLFGMPSEMYASLSVMKSTAETSVQLRKIRDHVKQTTENPHWQNSCKIYLVNPFAGR